MALRPDESYDEEFNDYGDLDEFAGTPRFAARPSFELSPRARNTFLIIASALVVVLTAYLLLTSWRSDLVIYLEGDAVTKLDEGAPVVIGTRPIGFVESIRTQEGRLLADVRIESEHGQGIPGNSHFFVESLNEWLPGNVGVRVYAPPNPSGAEPLRNGALVPAKLHPLTPPEIPPKFLLLLGAAFVTVVATFVFALVLYKWVNRLTTWIVVLLGGAILLGGYTFFQGQITPPDPSWFTEQFEVVTPREADPTP